MMIPRPPADSGLVQQRDALLESMLPDVPFDGWTLASLRSGAERAGLPPGAASDLFPGGVAQAAAWFSDWCDRRMLAELETLQLAELKVRERIATALNSRLDIAYPYREAVGRALSVLAQPQNGLRALTTLHATVDAIWYAAGDTATDINWYTKRALLGAVYGSVLLYWLNDRSEQFADTRRFIDRRIDDVMRVGQLTRPLGGGALAGSIAGAFRRGPLSALAAANPLRGLGERLKPFGRRQRMKV